MKMVKDWRRCWRWFSMQCLAISAALPASWAAMPSAWQEQIPANYVMAAAALVTVLGAIGRLIDQSPKDAGHDPNS